jgi:hypothetical protein
VIAHLQKAEAKAVAKVDADDEDEATNVFMILNEVQFLLFITLIRVLLRKLDSLNTRLSLICTHHLRTRRAVAFLYLILVMYPRNNAKLFLHFLLIILCGLKLLMCYFKSATTPIQSSVKATKNTKLLFASVSRTGIVLQSGAGIRSGGKKLHVAEFRSLQL